MEYKPVFNEDSSNLVGCYPYLHPSFRAGYNEAPRGEQQNYDLGILHPVDEAEELFGS